jgi:hypothetical protein
MFSGETYPVSVRRARRVENFLSRAVPGFAVLTTKDQQDEALTRRTLNRIAVEARNATRSKKGNE